MEARDRSLLGPGLAALGIASWAASIWLPMILPPMFFGFLAIISLIVGGLLIAAAYLPESVVDGTPLRSVRHWLKPVETRPSEASEKLGATVVTSINQSGGITAHTVNQAPKPEIVGGAYTIKNGVHRKELTVVSPYPVRELIVVAWGNGIAEISIDPMRTGVSQHGWTGTREDRAFTSLQNAQGPCAVVVKKADDEPLRFEFSVDQEIR
jgi:hypothetical protein